MEKFIKKGRKRIYSLDKIKVDEFVRLGLGTEKEFYVLTGKKEPKPKEEVKEVKKETSK